jgi:tRNA nucleotidyltransferase (CCA-adding enzyme)
MGGGGHPKAAAAVLEGALLEDVVSAVLAQLRTTARPAAMVADIMSRGEIRTVEADQTVRSAWEIASLHGHEGYPVVDDGVLVGMVTRLDLDRAVRHGLAEAPVRQIVQMEPARTVHPDTSVEALQDVMLGEGAAQLPVVDMGRVVGIVTRTDLLKLWSKGRRVPAPTVVDLDRALSQPRREAIHQVALAAREREERAFVVGGLPRDLLLGVAPGPDVDVVVEGDAVGLARLLEARHGGKVRVHERFGTAKWLLDPTGTEEIDLATARTEFYESATALPGVRGSSIENDLRRRDFTVNTLAADIDEDRYGQVLDRFGGVADLNARTIRVLHSLSFVEDPTRILRAARLCVRLGFKLEERTEAQARHAADLLGRVSGARIRAELLQTFHEPDPARVLAFMDDLGALGAIDPRLSPVRAPGAPAEVRPATEAFRRLRPELAARFPDAEQAALLATWLAVQGADQETFARLALPREIRDAATTANRLAQDPALAKPGLQPVELYRALGRTPAEHLPLAWAAGGSAVRSNIENYITLVLGARPVVTGEDLHELGVAPGPVYAKALDAVIEAMLEGRAPDRESQMAVAQAALSEAAGA